ncbi:hypothetical protein HanRHA438_Chr01g0036881 [Helianthus annuus]|nr:hypothetical protein HanIR_Chr01g0039791 [Helianthus annuus]KAJ0949271.1 hypothetical protein HanRHA438_Chr01g0036881 [Helianthus annuus]
MAPAAATDDGGSVGGSSVQKVFFTYPTTSTVIRSPMSGSTMFREEVQPPPMHLAVSWSFTEDGARDWGRLLWRSRLRNCVRCVF